jgi:hypothetical protein
LDEGEENKAGENVRGESAGEDFMCWGGLIKVGAKVEVRQVNRAKESVVRDDRVKEDVDGGERGHLSGKRAGRGKTITNRSAVNTTVYARRVAALGAGEVGLREGNVANARCWGINSFSLEHEERTQLCRCARSFGIIGGKCRPIFDSLAVGGERELGESVERETRWTNVM